MGIGHTHHLHLCVSNSCRLGGLHDSPGDSQPTTHAAPAVSAAGLLTVLKVALIQSCVDPPQRGLPVRGEALGSSKSRSTLGSTGTATPPLHPGSQARSRPPAAGMHLLPMLGLCGLNAKRKVSVGTPDAIRNYVVGSWFPGIPAAIMEELEANLTLEEIRKALHTLPRGKTP
ncbi:hypothetical protein NDU88_008224 [Pleurodeles waltl]|uniref:Uncharacterized protein n=1 Tax=Pleurodeles waltl TaxID=8319 RepID=A0AAV7NCH0_PLEWA|nr:hypothetical protein NDU88_008224 [Pleurodeles waltl]